MPHTEFEASITNKVFLAGDNMSVSQEKLKFTEINSKKTPEDLVFTEKNWRKIIFQKTQNSFYKNCNPKN